MRLLAIETATEACSVALFEEGRAVGAFHETIGRGHAEKLVPMISRLENRGRADMICVSLGPGSFTGVRIGLAAARSLGIAWNVQVRGYQTLALVAAIARDQGASDVTVCMNGGHGEWFVQDFGSDGLPLCELSSLTPENAAQRAARATIAGSRAGDLAAMIGHPEDRVVTALPDASCFDAVPEALLTDQLSPLYGRGPDAKLPSR
ncbi:tRNA (adenosine(37)-N6)-threonylcarbamoyltransferase complex dimerization subunit type 1 TsaB [Erythrobacter aquimaris]|uniref:tRNA (Adenosine(37)-N6)-threonylcarbamoyltransferase complex dimerization subunit type 1 TsaB n=1 Tax=Qipengyuania aquimaris TaxID=255984 RepID=A0A6I4TJ58_9SPHN|nr:tRNA (adenosine(37)-N6)-threonylcarbamoyltransferase complex dimerization subunit type 1 TsaB [Qipengyuania aquimaris]MXO95269.1 tRNA (adenosine(37)-N6)-threonylcarbamoyltransferase complex dimerization subunit type 1 TsaB [Qipengyuania aquimaris]